jgi:aldose 1-epimerase
MKKRFLSCIVLGIMVLSSLNCRSEKEENVSGISIDTTFSGLSQINFRDTIGGKQVDLFVLTNVLGTEAVFTNYGQRLVSLVVPDREGNFEDIVLGFDSLPPYTRGRGGFFGAVVGRYGNRIGNASFELDGTTYQLAKNNGDNHIHGGEIGFESVVWDVDSVARKHIVFHRVSPDMEEGYPGNLQVRVAYTLTDSNKLVIEYRATTDKKTHINLTNHTYFNLKGAGEGNVLDHIMQINADTFTAVDEELIPTGELKAVEGTPSDFRDPKAIGRDIDAADEQLKFARGYDHNFVLNSAPKNEDGLVFAARVLDPKSGRVMEVYTSEPGVQFYGGNHLNGKTIGKEGKAYAFRGGFCLETQHFPDSPNKNQFPTTILEPGGEYKSTTVYFFGVAN